MPDYVYKKPFIIPVFIPHAGCPHRCAFCDQAAITSQRRAPLSESRIRSSIETYLDYKGENRTSVEIAFFGGNFLGLKSGEVARLLDLAGGFVESGRVDGVRFSTRPDTIDAERLDLIGGFPISNVELGVQSMDDRVLMASRRGHTAGDSECAVRLLREREYGVGLQLMVGLPGDDEAGAMRTARKAAALSPDFVRIYPTVVLANSPLAKLLRAGEYTPLPLDRCVSIVKNMYMHFLENRIRVIRMGLQATGDLDGSASILAGPWHPAFGHLVHSEIFLDRIASMLSSRKGSGNDIEFRVHPRGLSRARGLKNGNIAILEQKFGFRSVRILADESAPDVDSIVIS